jgi:hypothetical protein
MADDPRVKRTRARRFLRSARVKFLSSVLFHFISFYLFICSLQLREFYQPLKEFGAESCADYFDSSVDDNELYDMGMDSDQVDRFRKALAEYTPKDIEEFLCKVCCVHR